MRTTNMRMLTTNTTTTQMMRMTITMMLMWVPTIMLIVKITSQLSVENIS
jgi:hypothetical protein